MKKWLGIIALGFAASCAAQVTVAPLVQPHWFFANPNTGGTPCAGCLFNTYYAGTTNPAPTYIDSTGTSTNPNPVVLDASGQASIWTATASFYKLVLTDPLGTVLWSADNVPGGSVGGGGGGSSGTVGSGSAGQIGCYLFNGTTVQGCSSINGITVDGSSPAALGYVANVSSDIQAQLNALAPLASPALTGAPTVPNASYNSNPSQAVNQAYVAGCCAGVGGPGTAGQMAYYATSGTSTIGNPNMDDGQTLANTFTFSENMQVANASAPSMFSLIPTTHAPTVVANAATLAAPATVSTAGTYTLPAAPGTGTVVANNTAGVVALSINPAGAPLTLYSAAGTPVPTCNAGTKGYDYTVSDATTPTYMAAYTSGGLITAKVICSYNGSAYALLTH